MLGGNRLLILCTLAVLISAPLGANLVTNGGFETTDWTGWTLTYSPVDPGYCSFLYPYTVGHSAQRRRVRQCVQRGLRRHHFTGH